MSSADQSLAQGQGQGSQGQVGQGPQQGPQPATSPAVEQQLQHPLPPPHQAPAVSPLQSSSDNAYKCQWVGCTEFHLSPEQLYVSGLPSTRRAEIDFYLGSCMRQAYRAQEHQQPQLAMRVGQLPRSSRQTRSHHFTHPSACALETTSMPILWQDVQASSGSQEACQNSR